MRAIASLFVLLNACADGGDKPAKKGPSADPLPEADECDRTVHVPTPIALQGSAPDADRHQAVFGADPEPFAVRYGWPSSDPSTSASFLWRTGVDTLASVVEYGIDGAMTETAEGASFRFGGGLDTPGDYRIHELKLCGDLEPSTTYTYRVGGDGHWSEPYTFTTPPPPGSFDTFRVAVSGDSRGAYETWGTVFATMNSHDPDFFLFTGDAVEFGSLQGEWDSWFAAMGDVLTGKALIPTHGNHEFLATNYFAQFSLPNNEEWFTHRYGDLVLVTLNDTVFSLDDRDVLQVDYLDEVFSEEAGVKAAMHHSSAYATCTRHASDLAVRDAWVPVWEEHNVDLVLAGHNHIYERSLPVRAGAAVSPEEGTYYVVTGGGGAPLYDEVEPQWWGDVSNPVEHFVIADFGPTGVEIVAYDLSGNEIDRFTIPR